MTTRQQGAVRGLLRQRGIRVETTISRADGRARILGLTGFRGTSRSFDLGFGDEFRDTEKGVGLPNRTTPDITENPLERKFLVAVVLLFDRGLLTSCSTEAPSFAPLDINSPRKFWEAFPSSIAMKTYIRKMLHSTKRTTNVMSFCFGLGQNGYAV